MVSKTTQYGGGRRLLIGLMLLAFSVVLLGETAHATLYPWGNKPRGMYQVRQEADDTGWGTDRSPSKPSSIWYSLLSAIAHKTFGHGELALKQRQVETSSDGTQNSTSSASGSGSTATE